MIKGVVKGRSLTIIGTDGDVFTSGSVGLKIKVTFDDEWNGLVKQAVFQNGSNAYISTAINDEFEVPLEVLSIPGRVLRIGIRGTNGTTLVIPTIYAECRIYEGSDKNGAAGQEWSPSEVDQVLSAVAAIDNKVGDLDDLLTTAKGSVVGAINELYCRPIPTGVSDELKQALLQLASKVTYNDDDGQDVHDYYDALYDALYPDSNVLSIDAVFTQGQNVIYDYDSLDTLRQYLVVTAYYDDGTSGAITTYTLSGTLSERTSTITVTYRDKTDTFTVTVSISLDSIAYGTQTYRDIFVTGNLFYLAGFEGNITLSTTAQKYNNVASKQYKINAGTPALTTDVCNSPTHSLACLNAVAGGDIPQMAASDSGTTLTAGNYLCGVAAKCLAYSGGNLGVQIQVPWTGTKVVNEKFGALAVTDGFEAFSYYFTLSSSQTGFYSFFGAMGYTGTTLGLSGYVDDIVLVKLPSGMTEAQAKTAYEKFVGIMGGN